jgi:transposase-like protein
MIALKCRRCASVNLQRNGHTASGQQKYHCKACHFYGTLETKDAEREAQRQLVEQLQLERLSQRAIARITGMSRSTIIQILKKSLSTDRGDDNPVDRAPDIGTRRAMVICGSEDPAGLDLARVRTTHTHHCGAGLWGSLRSHLPRPLAITARGLPQTRRLCHRLLGQL